MLSLSARPAPKPTWSPPPLWTPPLLLPPLVIVRPEIVLPPPAVPLETTWKTRSSLSPSTTVVRAPAPAIVTCSVMSRSPVAAAFSC